MQQKKENLWNQLLNEHSKSQKFSNKTLLMLGRKSCGKRTLIDSLTDISKTLYPRKNLDIMSGKLSIKGSAPILDYTYLNVVNLVDPDNGIRNSEQFSFQPQMQDQMYIFSKKISKQDYYSTFQQQKKFKTHLSSLHQIYNNPGHLWMIQLGGQKQSTKQWKRLVKIFKCKCLMESNKNVYSSSQYISKVVDYVSNFKEDKSEEDNQTKAIQDQEEPKKQSLAEGVLTTNFGIPLMVLVTKSEIIEQIEKSQKEKDWEGKFEAIQFFLRQFCLEYGATLLFTSWKAKTNLNIFYEYILHRLYQFPLNHQSDTSNGESLFIPIGIEDLSILKLEQTLRIIYKGDVKFEDKVPQPSEKRNNKDEITVDDNQEFLKKLKEKAGQPTQQPSIAKPTGLSLNTNIISQEKTEEGPKSTSKNLSFKKFLSEGLNMPNSTQQKQSDQLQNFYQKILQPQVKPDTAALKESAQAELLNRIKTTKPENSGFQARTQTQAQTNSLFNADDKAKIQNIIKLTQNQGGDGSKQVQSKLPSILNLSNHSPMKQ